MQLSDRQAAMIRNVFVVAGTVLIFGGLYRFMPYWMGLGLGIGFYIVAAAAVTAVEKRFREFVFGEVNLLPKVPDEARKFFHVQSVALEEIGFDHVGDFCLLPEPMPRYARIYASPGGKCFASIMAVYQTGGCTCYVSFASVAEDGVYLESAARGGKYCLDPDLPLRFQYLNDYTGAANGLAQHREFVERHAADCRTTILSFAPGQFREVLDYGHRLAGYSEYQDGRKQTPPPPRGGGAGEASNWTTQPQESDAQRGALAESV